MFQKFAVTNYRGFVERIEWDLSSPSNYEFNKYAIKDDIVKDGIIYGPNGSGKSNLGLAIFDIVNHLTQKQKKSDYYQNFTYAGRPNERVRFEYTFKFDRQTLQYNYAKASDGSLLEELLIVDGRCVFTRKENSLTIDKRLYRIKDTELENLAQNANNISIINYLLTSFPLTESHYLIKLRNFVNGMLWFNRVTLPEFIGFENNTYNLHEFIISNNLVGDFTSFLKNVSGQEFTFATPQANDKVLYCIYENHLIPFNVIASTGTHTLILQYFWLQKMSNASFVFIDEFDASYHFALSYEVCKRLFALDCQVFMTSHNTHIITNDLLRPDSYFLLDKGKVLPLNKCTEKELREAHNIEKIFKAGGFNVE